MYRHIARAAIALGTIAAACLTPPPIGAQVPVAGPIDTLALPGPDTLGFTIGLSQRRSRLLLASGKTYNRVEGLPVHFGPVFSATTDNLHFGAEVFGIIRSADTFQRDSRNLGHIASLEVRTVGSGGAGLKLATYDIVSAVEEWQMPRGEAGIAAFFLHRDYRDHFGRHGASLTGSLFRGGLTRLEFGMANERWSSLDVRQVWTVLRNNHEWRPNPQVDDGRARLLTLRWMVDTRNDVRLPSTGWLTSVEYEHGSATFDLLGPTSPQARNDFDPRSRYGRALLDLRRYNRISPESQLNLRLVAGSWLHGDELPLQRRFSVGGPATIPGVRFRDPELHPDVYTCSSDFAPPGTPAQCERVLLLQAEYRDELPFRPGTIFGGTPIRIRSAALTLRPVLVAFMDVGRGWLLPQSASPPVTIQSRTVSSGLAASDHARAGTLPPDNAPFDVIPSPPDRRLVYRRSQIPPLSTFSSDVGVGVDLGLLGAYLAMSLSESGAPINLVLRARSRF